MKGKPLFLSPAVTLLLAMAAAGAASVAAAAPPPATSPASRVAAASVEVGTDQGAAWRVDVPANWNHELVMFFHGTASTPVTYTRDEALPPTLAVFVQRGYALAQSGYSATGWAVEQAQADAERLRLAFAARHGAPTRSYVAGMSMGGTLVAQAIETRPEAYAGALSMCGAIEPTAHFLQHDFAVRAAFDAYFPGELGALVPVPDSLVFDEALEKKVGAALDKKPAARDALLRLYPAATAQSLPAILVSITEDAHEMQQRVRGNPFSNADYVYVGSGDDAWLNDHVRRYSADARANAYLWRWYTPSGKLTRPFLALHDTGDPLVAASGAFAYALAAQQAGHADLFVQQYVNREGHCMFTPAEVGRAFDELVGWVREGKRPVSGKLP